MSTLKPYLSTACWLTFITSSIYLTSQALANGWSEAASLLLQATITYILIAALEIWMPFREDWRWIEDKQKFTDIAHALFNDLFVRNFLLLSTLWLTTLIPVITENSWLDEISPSVTVSIILGVIFLECAEYWRHRLLHKMDFLWTFHALHHHLGRMHILRSGRIHFIDGMSRVLTVFLPALIIGIPHEAILWWIILLNAIGPISHSNLNIWTPKLLDRLLATPAVHRVHHAKNDVMMNSNLAPISPLMDIAFNTWYAPQDNPVEDVGIEPDFFPSGFFGQLLAPFKHFYSRFYIQKYQ